MNASRREIRKIHLLSFSSASHHLRIDIPTRLSYCQAIPDILAGDDCQRTMSDVGSIITALQKQYPVPAIDPVSLLVFDVLFLPIYVRQLI